MKEFMKKWLLLYGLASISATIIPAVVNNYWEAAVFSFQLLLALLIICLLQLLTGKIPVRNLWLSHVIELGMTLFVILLFGWIWRWYEKSFLWMMFLMVIPVFVVGYFLDILQVKREVRAINRQIQRRREKLQEKKEEQTHAR